MPSPIIYLIAGCNGAGKTIFAKEFLPSIGIIRFLNATRLRADYLHSIHPLSHSKLVDFC